MKRIPLLFLTLTAAPGVLAIPALAQESAPQFSAAAPPPLDTTGKQLNLIEPAAGPAPQPNPYTNPDQEKLKNDKQDWWRGSDWDPPDEDNPYHAW